ncbi:hypothetical protein FKM82_009211 [Ascaphus truei]
MEGMLCLAAFLQQIVYLCGNIYIAVCVTRCFHYCVCRAVSSCVFEFSQQLCVAVLCVTPWPCLVPCLVSPRSLLLSLSVETQIRDLAYKTKANPQLGVCCCRFSADMVKLSFNSALAQKDGKKEEENSEVLIIPDGKEFEDDVPLGQRRAWCWCMCFGLAFMLAGIVLGGAYLYKYFALQRGVYFCGVRYEDDLILQEPYADSAVRSFRESIQILEEEDVELINVPVPEFADSDPADIVHDFHRKLTAYLDLRLNKCYVIPLNTSIVMPPKNFLELLVNIKSGSYLPQSYLIHEQMVITDRIDKVDQLGFFIYRLCRDKETYKLQRRETIRGIQKREVGNCHKILHFENKFAVETLICEQ